MTMARKKTQQQIEFAKTVEYKMNAAGIMRPVKYAGRKPETKHRSTFGVKRAPERHTVKLYITEELRAYILANKGEKSMNAYIIELITKGAEQ